MLSEFLSFSFQLIVPINSHSVWWFDRKIGNKNIARCTIHNKTTFCGKFENHLIDCCAMCLTYKMNANKFWAKKATNWHFQTRWVYHMGRKDTSWTVKFCASKYPPGKIAPLDCKIALLNSKIAPLVSMTRGLFCNSGELFCNPGELFCKEAILLHRTWRSKRYVQIK